MSKRNRTRLITHHWALRLLLLMGAVGLLLVAPGCDEDGPVRLEDPPTPAPAPAPDAPPAKPPVVRPATGPAPNFRLDISKFDPTSDQWHAMYLAGAKSGHSHRVIAREERGGVPVWVYRENSHFELDRGGSKMVIKGEARVVEDDAGQVLEFESKMTMGGMPQTVVGKYKDGKLELTRGGRTTTHEYPKGALGPMASARKVLGRVAAGERSFVVTSFSTEVPDQADAVSYEVGEVEKVDLYGRVLLGLRVNGTSSLMPMPAARWIKSDGSSIQEQVDLPFGQLVLKPCDEQTAKSKNEPAEVFLASFVQPQREIKNPRELARAVYKLGMKDGAMESIYEGEGQKILERPDGHLLLEVTWPVAPEGVKAFQLPTKIEGMDNYLAPNAFIESDDELVMSMAKEAIGEEKDALKIAVLIQDYVREKIDDKNLNVGFATAAEVARSCEGDCTEHGVLCAALARAVGLPARVVTGLTYLGPVADVPALAKTGGFGFHMWAEVYVADGYWYPIDAAIGKYDGTHIALGKSDLAGASPGHNMTVETMTVMGKLTLEVVEPK